MDYYLIVYSQHIRVARDWCIERAYALHISNVLSFNRSGAMTVYGDESCILHPVDDMGIALNLLHNKSQEYADVRIVYA